MSPSIKPDFSVITQTIHTVATFLAPPPPLPPCSDISGDASPSSYDGLKNDLAEIGDSLKMGMIGITKFASNLLQFDQSSGLDAVGVTDGVVEFVQAVSVRPEWWIDFPLALLHKDFRMSKVQKDHTVAIQDLVPTLATLRRTIHNFMNEQQFWMIYFILLVPRLNENDRCLLLTPEILQMHEDTKGSMVNRAKTKASGEVEVDDATNTMKNKKREDDVCFTDVEDEEYKQTQSSRVSSASENSDWIRVGGGGTSKANRSRYHERRSESEGSSSDWHAVEDGDL
ncbi:uncharacterized protein LOC143556889 [Bidens hawaiensis]|uniref:uncharacterized protein LOC143556889 n=1 Tax=Bidens hawaiensis TaxID=980011 RepID=UPI00404984F2